MFYRQSIALFGIVLPLIVAGVVVGGAFFVSSSMASDFAEKQQYYKTYEVNRIGALGIEAEVSRKRERVAEWKKQLEDETKSTMNSNLHKIQELLPSKEFMPTSIDPLNSAGGLGSLSAQKSTQIHLGFRGTYRTVQRAFLELETRMPQLQLQELKMDPSGGASSLLNFDVTYTAWEN